MGSWKAHHLNNLPSLPSIRLNSAGGISVATIQVRSDDLDVRREAKALLGKLGAINSTDAKARLLDVRNRLADDIAKAVGGLLDQYVAAMAAESMVVQEALRVAPSQEDNTILGQAFSVCADFLLCTTTGRRT